MSQQEQSQQEFLQSAKAVLGLTWDALAVEAGIEPRALKNYRMPQDSQDHRGIPGSRADPSNSCCLHTSRIVARRPLDVDAP